MPTTGVLPPASCHCLRRCASSASSSRPSSIALSMLADRDLVVDADDSSRRCRSAACARSVRAAHDVLDHRHQAHLHAVVGVVDALDAVVLQLADLLGRDRAAAAAEHPDVAGAALAQHVDHVLEVLDVAALVAATARCRRRLPAARRAPRPRRAVVAQVHHLDALRLDQPAHDVDRGVVAVEQAGGGDEAQRAASACGWASGTWLAGVLMRALNTKNGMCRIVARRVWRPSASWRRAERGRGAGQHPASRHVLSGAGDARRFSEKLPWHCVPCCFRPWSALPHSALSTPPPRKAEGYVSITRRHAGSPYYGGDYGYGQLRRDHARRPCGCLGATGCRPARGRVLGAGPLRAGGGLRPRYGYGQAATGLPWRAAPVIYRRARRSGRCRARSTTSAAGARTTPYYGRDGGYRGW